MLRRRMSILGEVGRKAVPNFLAATKADEYDESPNAGASISYSYVA